MAEQLKEERVKFLTGKQSLFIENIRRNLGFEWDRLAKIFKINIRTLNDWRREKTTMDYKAILDLCNNYDLKFPRKIKILPCFWHISKAARQGALARNKLYGNPGTPEGRRKGGLVTIKKFANNPNLARASGVIIRKDISYPKRCSELAEFVGIVLGDGGLSEYQLRVTLNRETDIRYVDFVRSLIKKLFNAPSLLILHKCDKSIDVTVYSRNLVEFLEKIGLKRGNKIKNKVDVPVWIKRNKRFQLACLRGLMDTDGSFYSYSHTVMKRKYLNYALCFTNRSKNLLKSTLKILKSHNFAPIIVNERVYLYNRKDIIRYFEIVSSHNYLEKYKDFMKRTKTIT